MRTFFIKSYTIYFAKTRSKFIPTAEGEKRNWNIIHFNTIWFLSIILRVILWVRRRLTNQHANRKCDIREIVHSRNVHLRNHLIGNCPFEKLLAFWQTSFGIMALGTWPFGQMSIRANGFGYMASGKCPGIHELTCLIHCYYRIFFKYFCLQLHFLKFSLISRSMQPAFSISTYYTSQIILPDLKSFFFQISSPLHLSMKICCRC